MTDQRELVMYLNGECMAQTQAVEALKGMQIDSGGFYDAERTFDGRVFKLRQHLERLYRGLEGTNIDPGMSLDEIEKSTLRVLAKNRALLKPGDEFTIRQVVSLDSTGLSDGKRGVNVIIYCQPLDFAEFAWSFTNGVRIVTPPTYGVPRQASPDEVRGGSQPTFPLMSDQEGNITECAGANFMFVRDGRIKLPDRRNVLPGVSMQTVLELADAINVAVDEDDYSPGGIYGAGEAFISSTRFCLLPVATINGLTLSEELPGPVTSRLLEAWRDMVGLDFVQQAQDHLPPDAAERSTPHC